MEFKKKSKSSLNLAGKGEMRKTSLEQVCVKDYEIATTSRNNSSCNDTSKLQVLPTTSQLLTLGSRNSYSSPGYKETKSFLRLIRGSIIRASLKWKRFMIKLYPLIVIAIFIFLHQTRRFSTYATVKNVLVFCFVLPTLMFLLIIIIEMLRSRRIRTENAIDEVITRTDVRSHFQMLPENSQLKVKKSKVNFQGFNVRLEELVRENEELYDLLSIDQIDDLLEDRGMLIGPIINNPPKNIIQRNFCRQNLQQFWTQDTSDEENDTNDQQKSKRTQRGSRRNGLNEKNSSDDTGSKKRSSKNDKGDTNKDNNNDGDKDDNEEKDQLKTSDSPLRKGMEIRSIEDLIYAADIEKVVMIADESGSGMTTTMRTIAAKLKKHYGILRPWIIPFEFVEKMEFPSCAESINFLTELLCAYSFIQNDFMANLFQCYVKRREIIFLWDGIHLIKDNQAISFIKHMYSVKQSGNLQWIFCAENLRIGKIAELTLSIRPYRHVHFTQSEIRSIVSKRALTVCHKIDENASLKIMSELKRNPRNLAALIEVVNENPQIDTQNIFKLFEKISERIVSKKCEIKESFESYLVNCEDEAVHFLGVLVTTPDLNMSCTFSDKPFLNFFLAKYLIRKSTEEFKNDDFFDLIIKVSKGCHDKFQYTKTFIDHFMRHNNHIFHASLHQQITKIRNLFYNVEHNELAVNFISSFLMCDKKMIRVAWQMDDSLNFIDKVKLSPQWNYDELLKISKKYFNDDDVSKLACKKYDLCFVASK